MAVDRRVFMRWRRRLPIRVKTILIITRPETSEAWLMAAQHDIIITSPPFGLPYVLKCCRRFSQPCIANPLARQICSVNSPLETLALLASLLSWSMFCKQKWLSIQFGLPNMVMKYCWQSWQARWRWRKNPPFSVLSQSDSVRLSLPVLRLRDGAN